MKRLTLYEATSMLQEHIELWQENGFWVTAEIKSLNRNSSGHAYLELVQKAEGSDSTIAEARGTIWRNAATKLFSKFLFATDNQLATGMQVMLYATFNYSPKYGLSLNITDIDPTYTLGNMQQRRQQIIKRLTESGLMKRNKALPYPTPVHRIAIISSATAAGYTDFLNTLSNNRYGFVYQTELFAATMQGEGAEQSILEALQAIDTSMFDIIVIIRGGGSSTDLLAFDSEALAIAFANSPLPVITGIGHQRDTSILDMVAYHNAITPTATAEYILSQTMAIAERLAMLNQQLQQCSTVFIQRSHSQLEMLKSNLRLAAAHLIDNQRLKLQNYNSQLAMLHPQNILRRGYTLTTVEGHTVTSPEQVPAGSLIETLTANGTIKSQTL